MVITVEKTPVEGATVPAANYQEAITALELAGYRVIKIEESDASDR